MKVFNLPDDIFADKKEAGSDIIFHSYTAKKDSFKERSILHKNAISLVIQGEKTMHFAGQRVIANDKEFHFLSAGNCITSVDLSKQETFTSILIFFDEKVLTDFIVAHSDLISQLISKYETVALPYLSLKKDEFVCHYIASLQLMLKEDHKFSHAMKRLKFEELMLYLLERYPVSLLSFHASKEKTYKNIEIRKIVEANINNNLTIEELAFLCSTSASTFKRNFFRIYKTSPINWFLEQRMKLAANLLLQYHEKPSEIFYKIGYENHSSFTKSFKKFYSVSPKEFQTRKLTVQEHLLNSQA